MDAEGIERWQVVQCHSAAGAASGVGGMSICLHEVRGCTRWQRGAAYGGFVYLCIQWWMVDGGGRGKVEEGWRLGWLPESGGRLGLRA